MSDTKRMTELRPYMPSDLRANVTRIAELIGVSEGAAVALQVCREAIRDYCPPEESGKVVAALVGLESRKAANR